MARARIREFFGSNGILLLVVTSYKSASFFRPFNNFTYDAFAIFYYTRFQIQYCIISPWRIRCKKYKIIYSTIGISWDADLRFTCTFYLHVKYYVNNFTFTMLPTRTVLSNILRLRFSLWMHVSSNNREQCRKRRNNLLLEWFDFTISQQSTKVYLWEGNDDRPTVRCVA